MLGSQSLSDSAVWLLVVVFVLTVHEFSHAWAATKLGDPTPEAHGRLTLNPLAHLDILGTIMIIFVGIGWARPVPVNPLNFRNPVRDNALVALAGPGSNVGVAIVFALLFRLFVSGMLGSGAFIVAAAGLCEKVVFIALLLAIFNLIPLAPLDGSHILSALWPRDAHETYERFARISPFILIALLILRIGPGGTTLIGMLVFQPARFFTLLLIGL